MANRKAFLFTIIYLLALWCSTACQCAVPQSSTDSGADTDTDSDTDSDTEPEGGISFIWIANSIEHTLSKVDTQTEVETARYRTCPSSGGCDPSRTSVNLHGDAVVTNRNLLPSSVTKFAAAIGDCVDLDGSGTIETSTGPDDVLPWGQDECMLWHTELPIEGFQICQGARATAWDGTEDPDTGWGGGVWVGTCGENPPSMQQVVYKLDGNNGEVIGQVILDSVLCCYGGVVDGNDGFWIYDSYNANIVRVDMNTLQVTESISLKGGYGITADREGRVWVGGGSDTGYIYRYDPSDGSLEELMVNDCYHLRGIAVGAEKSAGYVWSADTDGTLYKIDQENMTVAGTYEIGLSDMVGVAVDFEGYVWAVDYNANAAYKFDPDTETHVTVPVGDGPDTYSDMTGMQLKGVIIPE